MSFKPTETTRWTEGSEAPAELRQLLEASRARLGTPDEVAMLAQRFAGALGPRAGLREVAPPGRALQPQLATSRWAAWLSGGVVLTGAAMWWAIGARPMPEPATDVTARAAVTVPAHEVAASEPVAPSERTTPSEPAGREPPSTEAVAPAAAPPVPLKAAPGAAARRRAPVLATSGETEVQLLERAQAALSEHPRDALALTREHRRRFPRGALVQEREVIAIDALERLGDKGAASQKAAEFEERYRGSVHQNRLGGAAGRAEGGR